MRLHSRIESVSFQREETSVTLFAQKNGKEQLTPSFDLIVLVLECVCMPTLNLQHNLLVYDTSHTFVKTSTTHSGNFWTR